MTLSSESGSSQSLKPAILQISVSIIVDLRDAAGLAGTAPVEAVHSARKLLKKYRALLKLVKYCPADENIEKANIFLRNLGRNFSELRDAHVRADTLLALAHDEKFDSAESAISKLIEFNDQTVDRLEQNLINDERHFEFLTEKLLNENLAETFLHSLNPDRICVFTGFIKTYAKCHSIYSELHDHTDAELLHEWRKRVKDLQYQFEIMSEWLPPDFSPSSDKIDTLTEFLGHDQDLNNLRLWIKEEAKQHISSNHQKALRKHIKRMHKHLRSKIDDAAEIVFSVSPKDFQEQLLDSHDGK
jgi:CHAD domain-containing protein